MNGILPRIEVRDLVKRFQPPGLLGRARGRSEFAGAAVDGVSFTVGEGETLALVGESGSGKTTIGRTILRLLEPDKGIVRYRRDAASAPVDVLALPPRELRRLRREVQIVFQDPLSSLDPRRTARDAIAEGLVVHRLARGRELEDRVDDLLTRVGLAAGLRARFPHELSGGERQRIAIARALAVGPRFLVLDEPVSALDASVQVQVVNLLLDLQEEGDLSYLFISHDLSVVRYVADRAAVVKAGKILETGTIEEVFETASHPYTRELLAVMPRI